MSKTKVLLIEDDKWQAELYVDQLERAGYQVMSVDSPHEAILAIDDFSPRVVVADILLKGNTIFPFLHEVASYEDTWGIPVVLVTTEASLFENTDMSKYGISSVLDKTIMGVTDIVSSVKRVLYENREG